MRLLPSSRAVVRRFPEDARHIAELQLRRVQQGFEPDPWKPMPSVGLGVREIRIHTELEHRVREVAPLRGMARRGLTHAAAAKILGVHPPRVSDLIRGKIELFSIETLIDMLARLGVNVKIVTARARKRAGAAQSRARLPCQNPPP